MNKILILASASLLCFSAKAQIADVSPAKQLLRGVDSGMYYPELSLDGNTLTFSAADHSNLREYDFVDNVTVRIDAAKAPKHASASKVAVSTEGSKLIVRQGNKTSEYTPVESYAGYLWPSLSPDGTKIMFVAAGKGIVVTDLKGKIISLPGSKRLEAPVWFGNNHIVAMNTTDDGHQLASSQIVLLTLDGSASQELTRPESMAMFPAASGSAERVVYNTIDGRLYLLNVKLRAVVE